MNPSTENSAAPKATTVKEGTSVQPQSSSSLLAEAAKHLSFPTKIAHFLGHPFVAIGTVIIVLWVFTRRKGFWRTLTKSLAGLGERKMALPGRKSFKKKRKKKRPARVSNSRPARENQHVVYLD